MAHKGLDFNGNGHVSRTESHMTYNIIRNGAKNSSYSSSSSYRPSHSSSGGSNGNTSDVKKKGRFRAAFLKFILILISAAAVFFVIKLIADYCADLKADSDYNKITGFIISEEYDKAIDIANNYHGSDFYYLECVAGLLKLDKASEGFTDCSEFSLERFQSELKWALICKDDFMSSYVDSLKDRENEIVKRYEDYLEQPILDEIKKNPPYRLMETKYIDKTSLGEPTSAVDIMIADYMDPKDFIDPEAARVAPGKIYTFIDGSDPYYVLCSETLVIKVSVNKRFERRTSANKNKTNSTTVTTSDDRYDTSRFYHAEDFYDFYYYDFRDFDEAKDYFEEHKKS